LDVMTDKSDYIPARGNIFFCSIGGQSSLYF